MGATSFVKVEDLALSDLSAFAEVTSTMVEEVYDHDSHAVVFTGPAHAIAPLVELMSAIGMVCTVDINRKCALCPLPA